MTETIKNNPFKTTRTPLADSSVQITVALDWSEVIKHRGHVLKEFQGKISLPGFRKGHIPEQVLLKQVGSGYLLEEMAEHAIESSYPEILMAENVRPLAHPKIEITKIEEGAPLEFIIKVDVFPEIKLPDYKKLAANENSKKEELVEVTDKEVDKAIEMIREQRAHQNDEDNTSIEEIDDSFAVTLGATDLTDFKEKVKTELHNEKERKQIEKKRVAILEAISSQFTIDLPKVMVEEELVRMKGQMEGNLAQMGLKFADYLLQLKKSQDDLFLEWRPDAEKRVRFELTLAQIAETESITPTDDEVEKESKHLMEHYKDITVEQAWNYATNQLRKQKTFEYLESLK